jgi:hypothetical protein
VGACGGVAARALILLDLSGRHSYRSVAIRLEPVSKIHIQLRSKEILSRA